MKDTEAMNRREFARMMAAVPAALAAPGAWGEGAAGMEIGFAEADITPAPGMEMPGGYGKNSTTLVHDPCKVRAAVVSSGGTRVAIVGVDGESLDRELVVSARKRVAAATGIPGEAVLLSASHSHSGGPLAGVRPGSYDHASELVRRLAYDESPMANLQYVEKVERKIAEAIEAAARNCKPMAVSVGKGREASVAFNRRFRMRNGQTWTHPGKGNPDILGPAGPTDPDVTVLGAFDGKGKLTGCIVNFACHATTSPEGFSANWIYYLEQTIRAVHGPEVVVVFLPGASGDITQVNNLNPDKDPPGEQHAQLVGGCVGAEALKVLLSSARGSLTPIRCASSTLTLKRRAPRPERVKRALDVVTNAKDRDSTEYTFAKEIVLLDALLQKSDSIELDVQAIQVGPSVFYSLPGEFFTEFGLELKKRSHFSTVFVASLANGATGYVPTEEALGPKGGGYETRLTSYSCLVPGAGRAVVEELLKLSSGWKPAAALRHPQSEAFDKNPGGIGNTAWTYGNVPPERN